MNISSTSMPAGILISASWRQVPTGSLQPSISKVQAPSASGGDRRRARGPARLGVRAHPHPRAAYAVGSGEHDVGVQRVVALAEDDGASTGKARRPSPSRGSGHLR